MLIELKVQNKTFFKLELYNKDKEVINIHCLMYEWEMFDKLSIGTPVSLLGRHDLNYLCHDQLTNHNVFHWKLKLYAYKMLVQKQQTKN